MRNETVKADITVVGGGLAGVSAAIAAARRGKKVSLVQNRPVLGGNSSSEVRVWVLGATGIGVNRYARETGIIGEMYDENQYTNPEGNPYYWDLVVLEKVRAEPNIELFLNTNIHEVEANGDENNREITSVTGWMMGSERKIRYESPIFLDCTGDGTIGFLAGAKYRIGREAKSEFNEPWAPEVADNVTLGSTMFFYTKDAGHPVKFVPPTFATDITKTAIPMRRVFEAGDNGCHYWWIEWGGEEHIHTLYDNERIRDELWSVIYGMWDYIKNSGKFDAENLTLEWVGSVPGKREVRRFIGDHILNQNEVREQKEFDDYVAFGGWSMDLHPPEGMYASEYISRLDCPDGTYQIPFRSLYSKNVNNLLLAGRNISATHIAFGSTRVMGTCSVIGEAVGAAATICVENNATPREVYQNHMKELQDTLIWNDAAMTGVAYSKTNDLAATANVSASSHLQEIKVDHSGGKSTAKGDLAFLFPVEESVTKIDVLMDVTEQTDVVVELWDTGKAENYIPYELQVEDTVSVNPGDNQWITVELPWSPESACNAFVIVRENKAITLHQSSEPLTGVLSFKSEQETDVSSLLVALNTEQLVVEWSQKKLSRNPFCFRVHGQTEAYAPNKVTDGHLRPYGGPHMWVSNAMTEDKEEAVELSWDEPQTISEVYLTFNNDVNEDLNNLHYKKTPFDVFPELVKHYRVEAQIAGNWETIIEKENNRARSNIHRLDQEIEASQLRLVVLETNGSKYAEVVSIRIT